MIFLNFSGIFSDSFEKIKTGTPNTENDNTMLTDLTEMDGVNGYCSDESARKLERILQGTPLRDIHFLDNGNYHYISSFFLKMIPEPFELVVFDHHTDMQPPGLIPCLSCGSWVLDSLKDAEEGINRMKRVVLIGPPGEAGEPDGLPDGIPDRLPDGIPDRLPGGIPDGLPDGIPDGLPDGIPDRLPDGIPDRLPDKIPDIMPVGSTEGSGKTNTGAEAVNLIDEKLSSDPVLIPELTERLFRDELLPVYISVDKDVLSEKEVKLNWDQGSMSFETLVQWIEAVACKRRLIGLDICGEPLYNQFPDENILKSMEMNRKFIELARKYFQ